MSAQQQGLLMNQSKLIKQCQPWIMAALFFTTSTLFVVLIRYSFDVKFIFYHFEWIGISDLRKLIFCFAVLFITGYLGVFFLKRVGHINTDAETFYAHENNSKSQNLLLFSILSISLIFFLNCVRYYKLFPIIPVGESNYLLSRANQISDGIFNVKALMVFFRENYNTGLSYLYYLIRPIVGDSVSSVKLFQISSWTIIVASFIFLFSKAYKLKWYIIILMAPIATNAIMLESVRRYKWHVVSLVASFAIYLFYYGLYGCANQKNNNGDKHPLILASAILLFTVAIVFYHMLIIYFSVIVGFYVASLFIRKINFRSVKILLFSSIIIIILCILISQHPLVRFDYLKMHIAWAISNVTSSGGQKLIFNGLLIFSEFFIKNTSIAVSILLFIGFISAIARFKNDWFCRLTACFFIVIMIIELPTLLGIHNPDWNSFFLIPLLALLMIGIKEIASLVSMGSKNPKLIALTLLPLAIVTTIVESNAYYTKKDYLYLDSILYPDSPSAELALIFLDMNQKKAVDDNVVILIPHVDAELSQGGWPNKDPYYFSYLIPSLSSNNYYLSLDGLTEQLKKSESHDKRSIIVYYSKYTPSDSIDNFISSIPETLKAKKVTVTYPVNVMPNIVINYLYLYSANEEPLTNFIEPYPNLNQDDDGLFESLKKFNDAVTHDHYMYGNF